MKSLIAATLALFVGMLLPIAEAEAKRLGGGTSFGMKRSVTPPPKPAVAPTASKPTAASAATGSAAQAGKRSWLGPLAGIAGAVGLAALFSSLGMGEQMADFLMILLLVIGGFLLLRWFMGRQQKPASAMSYAANGPVAQVHNEPMRFRADHEGAADTAADVAEQTQPGVQLPRDFDAADFIRHAKRNFLRLQAANDAGDLEDIRDFTTPEMYAEIKLQFGEREGAAQRTDVLHLDAEILEYSREDNREILSVRFRGEIREEEQAAAESFDEAWHLVRPLDRSRHWAIGGIQQLN